ncbi:MAG: hypothetical protein AB7O96_12405 [Pseudobdellovibrionaceae bacterium]
MSFLFFAVLLFSISSQAQWEYNLSGDYRTYESGLSLEAQAAYNSLLWGTKGGPTDWKYGFLRGGGDVAVHGKARVFAEIYPISILRLSVQQSYTSRFYDVKPFDCKLYDCDGVVGRTTALAQVVGAVGDFMGTLVYSQTNVTNTDDGKPLALESENLALRNRGGLIESKTAFFGYKYEDQTFGVVAMGSNVMGIKSKSDAQYIVYRIKMPDEIKYSILGGQYHSSFSKRDLSIIVGAEWSAGETLSLF